MKKLFLISPLIILLTIIIIGLAALYQHNKISSISVKLQSGEKVFVPAFSLPELYNQELNFSNQDLLGKYSLINLFASWCFNCKAEHALLMEIYRSNKINIYGIAWRDINQNTKDYLAKNGNPYLKIGVDNKGILSKLLSVSGTPESFLVNPQGQVIYYWRGAIDEDALNKLLNVI
jgi:cytochrome c biogenesis protein CcmG, thiol:disulfide interchange protein DsbE